MYVGNWNEIFSQQILKCKFLFRFTSGKLIDFRTMRSRKWQSVIMWRVFPGCNSNQPQEKNFPSEKTNLILSVQNLIIKISWPDYLRNLHVCSLYFREISIVFSFAGPVKHELPLCCDGLLLFKMCPVCLQPHQSEDTVREPCDGSQEEKHPGGTDGEPARSPTLR